jgi:hypothetical protein
MKVEIGELKQIIKFCEARLFQALNEADQLLAETEKCTVFNIAKSRLCAQCKVLKMKVVRSRHSISTMNNKYQSLRLSEHMAELARLAPRAVLVGEHLIKLILFLQGFNNGSKHLLDGSEELGAIISDLSAVS